MNVYAAQHTPPFPMNQDLRGHAHLLCLPLSQDHPLLHNLLPWRTLLHLLLFHNPHLLPASKVWSGFQPAASQRKKPLNLVLPLLKKAMMEKGGVR